MNTEEIILLGQKLALNPIDKAALPILYADEDLFFTDIEKIPVCVLKVRDTKWTPKQFGNTAKTIGKIVNRPMVFFFNNIDRKLAYRLKENSINFIVGDTTVYLPEFMMAYKKPSLQNSEKLVPIAQIILLSCLLKHIPAQATYKEIQSRLKITYLNVSRGIRSLEVCHLCEVTKMGKTVNVRFSADLSALWADAQPYLINPKIETFYCDRIEEADLPIGGITALSEYGDINPENVTTFVMNKDVYRSQIEEGQIKNKNPYEGKYKVEIWKYNPKLIVQGSFVDNFSLYLTLKDNVDPRIQKELDKMIKKLW
jgi:hypothetical protein